MSDFCCLHKKNNSGIFRSRFSRGRILDVFLMKQEEIYSCNCTSQNVKRSHQQDVCLLIWPKINIKAIKRKEKKVIADAFARLRFWVARDCVSKSKTTCSVINSGAIRSIKFREKILCICLQKEIKSCLFRRILQCQVMLFHLCYARLCRRSQTLRMRLIKIFRLRINWNTTERRSSKEMLERMQNRSN